jgi:steroid 5-alpha reductase family enzyme|tara:strand:+ start:3497 stop:4345 length:849 start_codon:yes stop_codon:yes gene_type:complete
MKNSILYVFISLFVFSLSYLLAYSTGLDLVQKTVLIVFVIQWVLFIPAYLLQTEKFYDLAGSFTYIFAVLFVFYKSGENLLKYDIGNLILSIVIIVWALRLGSFLFKRIKKAGEDKRFKEIKKSPTRFFMTWSLQGMWVSVCSACALTALANPNGVQTNLLFYCGLFTFLTGFILEIIADTQKSKFRSNPENKDRFINSGLWSLSRHPNYLGEIILWLGITIMSISALSGWQYVTLISPIFTYVLLVYVSGVRLLEASGKKKWGHLEDYKKYLKNTPSLIIK